MSSRRHHLAAAVAYLSLASLPACQASSPSAIVIPPSQYFEGNDGPWSSFNVRVGTTHQDARVLVSTAAPETLVILSEYGCSERIFDDVPTNCAVSRGNLFNPNESSTWHNLGIFGINDGEVGLGANLGYQQPAQFGLDVLGVGLVDGSGGITLKNQTVGGIATASPFYLGIFGINNQPLNFTSLGNFSSPSFLTTLKDQKRIPSLSWSYTAGAIYRLKKVYGQLIFSGYDTSRFTENAVTFTMADDITRDLVVALQAIIYSGADQASLLPSPINIYIDSTDPNIWLPKSAVEAFESAFDLTLDEDSNLYLINDTHHNSLLKLDAEVSFRLSDVLDGGDTVTITLPYQAFALRAEYPLVEKSSYYFPLKLAANESQYTLGRTFLQEAYLTADYERHVFNISQCTWDGGADETLVTILPKSSQSGSNSDGGKDSDPSDDSSDNKAQNSLSTGAIVGIVIGVVAVIAAAGAFFIIRRRRQSAKQAPNGPARNEETDTGADSPGFGKSELHANAIKPHTELMGDVHHFHELHSESKEAVGQTGRGSPLYELVGSDVPKVPAEYSNQPSPALSVADGLEGEARSTSPLTETGSKKGEVPKA
ncbi:Peptidase A1 domain-containing protein [Fusarium sp. Ph1]|nr:Peptidase A1 domain-containing protein [Fusarium sp. Ph1]